MCLKTEPQKILDYCNVFLSCLQNTEWLAFVEPVNEFTPTFENLPSGGVNILEVRVVDFIDVDIALLHCCQITVIYTNIPVIVYQHSSEREFRLQWWYLNVLRIFVGENIENIVYVLFRTHGKRILEFFDNINHKLN